jgi:hypothetical protein
MSRSQRHLRFFQGYDSDGRTAYEFGSLSLVSSANQWARSTQRGYSPPSPSETMSFALTAAAGGTASTAVLTFTGATAKPGTLVYVTWQTGSSAWYRVGYDVISFVYGTTGSKTITAVIGGTTRTTTFTAA